MKTLSQLKMILIILTIGLLSCKNNKDGYSDEIDTTKASTHTASAARPKTGTDTNATSTSDTEPKGVTGAGSISSPEKPANRQTTTANNGTGPGPSAKDGSVYDISSQTKKDTTKLGSKAKAKASKEKKANKK